MCGVRGAFCKVPSGSSLKVAMQGGREGGKEEVGREGGGGKGGEGKGEWGKIKGEQEKKVTREGGAENK